MSLVTVHWYKATKEAPNTPATLLDEGPLRAEADNLRQLVQVANSYGKPLRVAEMNTISNSGLLGVSNVFAGEARLGTAGGGWGWLGAACGRETWTNIGAESSASSAVR